MNESQSTPISNRTVFIFLSFLGLILYLNALNAPFHYDDIYYLKENLGIKSIGLFWDRFTTGILTPFSGRLFLLFTFLMNYKLGGLDTFGYHILNLLIHIGNAFFLYLIVRKYATTNDDTSNPLHYLLPSVLFLVLPINTESVTYLSSRSSELSALFVLLAMYFFFRGTAQRFHAGHYLAGMVFFLLGLMTKESAIVFPALLLLFDFFFIAKGFPGLRGRLKYHVLPLLAMCMAAAASVSLVSAPVLDIERSWSTHILTELTVFVSYLKLLVLPVGLNIDHDVLPATTFDGRVLLSVLVLSALLVAAVAVRKKYALISFSIFWFFINMAVFLVIRLNDYMAERWVYLASMGFCIGLAEILTLLAGRHRRTGIAVIGVFLILYGTLTVMRNHVYTRPVLLWEDAARQSPEKYRPLLNLSSAYMENGNTTLGALYAREAITKWKKRGARNKDITTAYLNIAAASGDDTAAGGEVLKAVEQSAAQNVDYYGTSGALALNAGKYPEALDAFKKALALSPQSAAFLYLTGECYEVLGQKKIAEEYFVRATAVTPQSAQEFMGQGEAFSRLGDYRKASEAFHAALKADPLDVSMRVYYATIMLENGYLDQADEHFSFALKLSPSYAPAYKGMGQVMLEKGRNVEAIGYFDRALALLPLKSTERKSVLALMDTAKKGAPDHPGGTVDR